MIFPKTVCKRIVLIFLLGIRCLPLFSQEMPQGLTPEILYNAAIEENTQLQLLSIDKKQAEIDVKTAKARLFPNIDFQTTMSYTSNPFVPPISLTAGELGAYNIGGEEVLLPMEDMLVYKGMENTHYNFNFIIDQPFTLGGR